MTHHDVIIFKKLKLKKNPKTNNCKKNFEIPLNPGKDMNITRLTSLRFAWQVSHTSWACFDTKGFVWKSCSMRILLDIFFSIYLKAALYYNYLSISYNEVFSVAFFWIKSKTDLSCRFSSLPLYRMSKNISEFTHKNFSLFILYFFFHSLLSSDETYLKYKYFS